MSWRPELSRQVVSLLYWRDGAEQLLLYVLAGFAGSVILTRSFLEWAGYPQIASGDFHIAHVLWGGLLLFAAALMLLIWRGRTVYRLAAVLAGVGFGLFIDEVGKFITSDNDYFYPLAAPIIYAFFLLTVFIYLRLRGRQSNSGRPQLYHLLDLFEQGIEPAQTLQEAEAIRARLATAASTQTPAGQLAGQMLAFLQAETANQGKQTKVQRPQLSLIWSRLSEWFNQLRLKRLITAGFVLLSVRGLGGIIAATFIIIAVAGPPEWRPSSAPTFSPDVAIPISPTMLWLAISTLLFESFLGTLFVLATAFLVSGRMGRALALGYWALVISLTAVHFLVFYFNQFDAITTILFQFVLLLAVVRYRSHYL